MSSGSDREARRRALDPQRSFIVQAPAGSGKTGLLTQRFLRLLATVETPEQIVAITFTRKAAAEMRRRIVQALAATDAVPVTEHERTNHELAQAARVHAAARGWNLESNPARLRIHTIDAFCNSIAAQSPILARAGAELRVADNAQDLYRQAALRALGHAGESTAVDTSLLHRDNQVPATSNFIAGMLARRDQWLGVVLSGSAAQLRERLQIDLGAEILDHLQATLAVFAPATLEQISRLLRNAAQRWGLQPLSAWRASAGAPEAKLADLARWRSLATTLLTADDSWRRKVGAKEGFPAAAREDKAALEHLLGDLSQHESLRCELRWLRQIPAPTLDEAQWHTVQAFVEVLKLAAAELELVFRETGQVDYPAILRAALHAVRGDDAPTELAMSLERRIRHLLVDEFQDTSLAQYELLEALTAEWSPGDGRTLFCVGDPMQSIYRFRQAEVGLFLRVREHGLGPLRPEPLQLQTNFRSQQRLVEWCNEVFAHVLPAADSIARGAVRHVPSEHVQLPLDPAVRVHAVFSADAPAETALLLAELDAIRRRTPEATIGVLVRQRAHVAHLAAALRERGSRFQAVELETLDTRPVVRDLLALTRGVLHEADRTAWVSLLRSPVAGLTLADLTALVGSAAGSTVPELLVDPSHLSGLSEGGQLRALKVQEQVDRARQSPHRSVCRRVEGLWLALGGPATLTDSAALTDARAYFDHLRALEAAGPLPCGESLDAQFADLFAEPDPQASPLLQIMTVHKAKGLEFDVVLLPGLGRGRTRNDPPLLNWLEVPHAQGAASLLLAPIVPKGGERDAHALYVANRQRECALHESARLLYVAATRARRELHLFGHVRPRLPDGAPQLGNPDAGSALAMLWPAVREEFARQFSAAGEVVAAAQPAELRAKLRRLPTAWRLPEPPASVSVKGLRSASPPATLRPQFEWAGEVSRHVGTVVHAELDRWSRCARLPAASEVQSRRPGFERLLALLGVPGTERGPALERIVAALLRTLEDPRGRWLFSEAHREVRSEYALTGSVGPEIVDVVLDRTFVDEQGTRWIIDFKTSAHEGAALEAFLDNEVGRYREQLERYAQLMRRLGGARIRVGLYFPMLAAWREWSVQ